MKKLCLLVVLILTLSFVQAQKVQDKLVRMLPAFSSLNIERGFLGNVILCQSPESKLEIAVVSADHNAEYIASEVANGKLTLSIKEHPQKSLDLKVLYVKIYSPKFDSVTSEGTCDITIENEIKGDNFTLALNGSGNTQIYGLQMRKDIEIITSSARVLTVKQEMCCENFTLDANGAGDIHINELQMRKNIVINASGASRLYIKKCQAEDIVMQLAGTGIFKVEEITGMTSNNKVTINTSRVGNIVLENISADNLFLKKTNAGYLFLTDVSANELRLKNEGTGNVKVTGNVVDVDIYNDGVGNFYATGLTAENANVVNNSLNAIHLKVKDTAYISGEVTQNDSITSMGVVKVSGPAKVFLMVPILDPKTGEETGEKAKVQIK